MRTQATVADVHHLALIFSSPELTDSLVQEVSAADLAAGLSSTAFAGLPVGDGTLEIQVFDRYDDLIGTQMASITIAAGTTTQVALNVPLDPNAGPGSVQTMITVGPAGKVPPLGAHADVTFTSPKLINPVTTQISAEDLAAGPSHVTFPGMPQGEASLAVTVYDANGTVIGSETAAFHVESGATTPVGVFVPLAATPGTTGDLAATITFTESAPSGNPEGEPDLM
jgi:hypothetical protein